MDCPHIKVLKSTPGERVRRKKRRKRKAMRGMFIFLFFQVVAAHEPSKFPETRSKVSTVTQQINAHMSA